MNNISEMLKLGANQLAPLGEDARFEAEIILAHLLNKDRGYLYAHPESALDNKKYTAYFEAIAERASGFPLAYITKVRSFWSLALKVSEDTLIPRHETERIVEIALELIPNKPQINILDLGTGSGAIALALGKERPSWSITACDISSKALKIAQENALNNKIKNVCFYQSDWFNQIPKKKYHAIVSNPPYISAHDPHLLQGDLRFEPHEALVGGKSGLKDIQTIIEQSPEYLVPGGLLLLEHGFDQKIQIEAILNQLGYINPCCWKDILGHDRISGGWQRN